jgi:hypothetical protein
MRLVTEMLGQLRRHRPLDKPLGQLREHPARADDLLLGPGAREQLVDHLIRKTIADRLRKLKRLAAGRSLLDFVDMTLLRFRHTYTEDRTLPSSPPQTTCSPGWSNSKASSPRNDCPAATYGEVQGSKRKR